VADQARRAQHPEEAEAQESIEPAARITPRRRRRTPTRCQTLKSIDGSCALVSTTPVRPADFASGEAIDRDRRARVAWRVDNGMRGAGVERRYGFVWREKL